jgi:hypothetical protein
MVFRAALSTISIWKFCRNGKAYKNRRWSKIVFRTARSTIARKKMIGFHINIKKLGSAKEI